MIELKLSQNYVAFVDEEDADLAQLKWSASPKKSGHVYALRNKGRDVLHRVVLSRMLGRPLEKGEWVDHIDNDGLNNTRANLRLASPSENQRNRKMVKGNTSGFKGAYWDEHAQKWRAQINLGVFDTPEEAHRIYCEVAFSYFREFANFGESSPYTIKDGLLCLKETISN